MRTPTQIFEEVLDAWRYYRGDYVIAHGAFGGSRGALAAELSALEGRARTYREEFREAMAALAAPPLQTASPEEAFSGRPPGPFLQDGDPLGALVECAPERVAQLVGTDLRALKDSLRAAGSRRGGDLP